MAEELPDSLVAAPVETTLPRREGFLPIKTNGFDRVFISVVLFVALHLFWMRVLEAYLPLFVATILSVIVAIVVVTRG